MGGGGMMGGPMGGPMGGGGGPDPMMAMMMEDPELGAAMQDPQTMQVLMSIMESPDPDAELAKYADQPQVAILLAKRKPPPTYHTPLLLLHFHSRGQCQCRLFYGCPYRLHLSGNNRRNSRFTGS